MRLPNSKKTDYLNTWYKKPTTKYYWDPKLLTVWIKWLAGGFTFCGDINNWDSFKHEKAMDLAVERRIILIGVYEDWLKFDKKTRRGINYRFNRYGGKYILGKDETVKIIQVCLAKPDEYNFVVVNKHNHLGRVVIPNKITKNSPIVDKDHPKAKRLEKELKKLMLKEIN